MFVVHVDVILNLQNRCNTSLGDRHQRKTLFVVDVSVHWATTISWMDI